MTRALFDESGRRRRWTFDLARVIFGKANRIKAITAFVSDADEADAWTMTAVAAQILGSECAYRIPTSSGAAFVLLSGLTKH
jgi:hypothetical protein